MGGFSANILVGYEDVAEFNGLVDEMGIDSEELGGLVAWAKDLYEHGILSKSDLGGIDLKWGSVEVTCELIKKIAYREGKAPSALDDGFRCACEVFGEESKWYAYEVHGCGCPSSEIRNRKELTALRHSTSHNGARVGDGIDSGLDEAATCCLFQLVPNAQLWGAAEEAIRLFLNAACGWNLKIEDTGDIGQRNYYFNRCISLREGYQPSKDDYLPLRAFDEPITDKYGQTWVWKQDKFEAAKKNYYVTRPRLTEDGLPPQKELERLGLGFVIPVLEPLKAIG